MKQNTASSEEKYTKLFNWKANPFSFKIIPELFTGYRAEASALMDGVTDGVKFSLLLGPTGSGKTTLLRYLVEKVYPNKYVIYLPKPPADPKDLVEIFTISLKRGLMQKIFSKEKVSLYNLAGWVNKKLDGEKCILFIDEAHEASTQTLEWVRTLTDHVNSLSVVFAGLPTFEGVVKENLETLLKRITLKVELGNLNKPETKDMIKRRIEYSGGEDVKPFTLNSLDYIYDKTGGFPREVLRYCNEAVQSAVEKNLTIIDVDFLDEQQTHFHRSTKSSAVEDLTQNQKAVLETLAKYTSLTPTEVVHKIDSKEYKNKDNAIRSVNNLLVRLMKDGMVVRRKKGKAFKYELSGKLKTIFVNK